MEIMAGIVFGLGTAFLGEYRDSGMFRLASAISFIWVGIASQEPLIFMATLGLCLWQFYTTFFGGRE